MKILLSGANGYIGMRLLPVLVEAGHDVVCCVRDSSRLDVPPSLRKQLEIVEIDFLEEVQRNKIPPDIDAAYYLIHSMSASGNFARREQQSVENFLKYMEDTAVKQIIYLSGIVNSQELSPHLESRLQVEKKLMSSRFPTTVLRAGIIVGSGSASFEIIRDLVEKLPIMIAPKWINTQCQPIAIRNVIDYLNVVLGKDKCMNETFDIGGPEVLTYREMLMQFAEVRKLKRRIISVPVMTPRLSSYWLYFVTSTSYSLAVNLVDSMKVDVVVEDERLQQWYPQKLLDYKEAVSLAFSKIEQHMVISSWKDAMVAGRNLINLREFVEVPRNGVFRDCKEIEVENDPIQVSDNIFSIGGARGWYYGSFLWRIRGFLDKLVGGVGLRRGRTHKHFIYEGDVLDFWRVLVADRENNRLLLYAEMRLPGEAWLEFRMDEEDGRTILRQTATFRPHGIWGRVYWWTVWPFHYFVFNGMIRNLQQYKAR